MPHCNNHHMVEVFDPDYKFATEVPASLVRHLPPSRLNIRRRVFCRNYVPGQSKSCNMGNGCKFVHADVDPESLESHPIHVKYSWRHEDVCTYARLPAGEVLRVTTLSNGVEEIPSELILVTCGSAQPSEINSHCVDYHVNRMCHRGERCNFFHVIHVDSSIVGDFKRAPAVQVSVEVAVVAPKSAERAQRSAPLDIHLTQKEEVSATEKQQPDDIMPPPSFRIGRTFRHNPYAAQSSSRTWVA